MMTPIG
jgi:hypothetical protein